LRLLTSPETSDRNWADLYRSPDLPEVVNPVDGFLASANNRPAADGARPYGGHFPQDERVRRLQTLLAAQDQFSLDDLRELQMDVVSLVAQEMLALIRPRLLTWTARSGDEAAAIAELTTWDGAYDADSTGALIFEAFANRFTEAAFAALGRSVDGDVYIRLGRGRSVLLVDAVDLTDEGWAASLAAGLDAAAPVAASGQVWGDVHRLDIQHIFGAVPLLGGRYRLDTIPVPGSRETIFKTAHDLTTEDHRSFFGAQARHLSDLADPNANQFVLLGGQDGWLNSAHFADQTQLWRQGRLITVPLEAGAVRAWTYATTELSAQ
jgi:penicillin amidase